MNRLIALFVAALALIAVPAQARMVVTEVTTTETITENGVTTTTVTTDIIEKWVEDESDYARSYSAPYTGANSRLVDIPVPAEVYGQGRYGPFRILDSKRAALVNLTDSYSAAAFRRLLAENPGIEVLEMHDCPGTHDDRANLAIGRMIRDAGITTHVPSFGSVRSGAVELFLAGAERQVDDGAQFAVHAWQDEMGYQAHDYAASDPQNAKYLAYYQEMGMSAPQAKSFYAMTNSVPHQQALWLDAHDMRGWIAPPKPKRVAAPASKIAYAPLAILDLDMVLN